MRVVVGVLAALAGAMGAGWAAAEPPVAQVEAVRLKALELREDAALLRRAFEAVHPGLHRYNSHAKMAARWDELDAELGRDMTRREAFVSLSKFAATIRCGHTFVNPHNQSKAVATEVFAGANVVPFHFRWIDGRMIVTRDLTEGERLKVGTEIAAINGAPVKEILDRLMTIARADGANDAKRVSLLEVRGTEKFETFDIYLPLFFPSNGSRFELEICTEDGGWESVSVAALRFEDRLAAYEKKERMGASDAGDAPDAPLWRLSFMDDGTAVLPMASWVAYQTKWDWKGFIEQTFDTLVERGTDNLVIDLRGNEGGSDVGDQILARLIDHEVPRSPDQRFVRYIRIPAELDSVLDTWDSTFKDWGKDAIGPMDLAERATGLPADATEGYYFLRGEDPTSGVDGTETLKPKGRRYGGNVYILIDASNSSATFEFARMAKKHGVATLVGQTTGGNLRGINGGAFFFLRLPHSGLEIDLPIIGTFPRVGDGNRADAGVEPDVPVKRSIEDVRKGVDAEMREVRRLIEGKMERGR